MDTGALLLFVSGMSPRSVEAIENVKAVSNELSPKIKYDLKIIDITQEKEQAKIYDIIAIPTLLKLSPLPKRIMVGDLSDRKKVVHILTPII